MSTNLNSKESYCLKKSLAFVAMRSDVSDFINPGKKSRNNIVKNYLKRFCKDSDVSIINILEVNFSERDMSIFRTNHRIPFFIQKESNNNHGKYLIFMIEDKIYPQRKDTSFYYIVNEMIRLINVDLQHRSNMNKSKNNSNFVREFSENDFIYASSSTEKFNKEYEEILYLLNSDEYLTNLIYQKIDNNKRFIFLSLASLVVFLMTVCFYNFKSNSDKNDESHSNHESDQGSEPHSDHAPNGGTDQSMQSIMAPSPTEGQIASEAPSIAEGEAFKSPTAASHDDDQSSTHESDVRTLSPRRSLKDDDQSLSPQSLTLQKPTTTPSPQEQDQEQDMLLPIFAQKPSAPEQDMSPQTFTQTTPEPRREILQTPARTVSTVNLDASPTGYLGNYSALSSSANFTPKGTTSSLIKEIIDKDPKSLDSTPELPTATDLYTGAEARGVTSEAEVADSERGSLNLVQAGPAELLLPNDSSTLESAAAAQQPSTNSGEITDGSDS